MATSFVCASATIRFIEQQAPATVTLVSTDDKGEDQACADYLEARLCHEQPNTGHLLNQVYEAGRRRIDWANAEGFNTPALQQEFEADLECSMDLDRFDFALVIEQVGDLSIMKSVS